NVPSQADLANPQKYLPMSRNMYLETDDNVTLGVWQILKIEENQNFEKQTDDSIFEHAFLDSTDTMIYFHGNTGSRLLDHRIELYKILRKQFHVITFDYRGFADSTNETPSETKLVKDCEFIYKWVANKTKGSIFVWGHSLGTSLVTHTIFNLHSKIKEPAGVFLEAPITNMADEIVENPIAKIFSFLPWFDYVAIQPMKRNGLTLESDRYICEIDAPIIILHAQDDNVIPIKLGKKLYAAGKKCRRGTAGRIIFHEFQSTCGYKHKYIYRAPEISFIIKNCRTASRFKRMVKAALNKSLQEKISVIRRKTKKPRCVTKDNEYIPEKGESEETETSEIEHESFSTDLRLLKNNKATSKIN
uniref:Monoacylglycerol lipase ABHD12-like n=1 Tax=Diabrotica virgifera virgifera TaxID=50390 RepID=A0A6P7GQK2_DIAVI